MNDRQLDKLLELRKKTVLRFSKDEKKFAEEFFAKIDPPAPHRFPFLRCAAILLILIGVAAAFCLPLLRQPHLNWNKYNKISEAVRLFGGDAAVIFFDNELITGEREAAGVPSNLVTISLWTGTQKLDLSLACSDNDSIYLDDGIYSGDVVVSRPDATTLVLDLELKIDGKMVRTVIPAVRRVGNRYEADIIS